MGFSRFFQFLKFFNILLWGCEHMKVIKTELQKEPLILFIWNIHLNLAMLKKSKLFNFIVK
jgi:hypothetical protein